MKTKADFADWLSPMLVKELRQGMRSRLFVLSFLVVQGAMTLIALIALSAAGNQQDTRGITALFWTIICVPLLLIMPLSGLGTIANERKTNSLELIFLTRLTARRILAGKWFAVVAQTALFVCAVLPYAVLRYFIGGVNLGKELLTLGLLFLASALLSGVAIGLSPQLSRVTRGLLVVGVFLSLQFLVPILGFGIGGGLRGASVTSVRGSATSSWTYLGFAGFAGLLLLGMLELGASKIAPAASNHSTSRRLIGLGALLIAALFGASSRSAEALFYAAALLVPICVGALCEVPSTIANVYRPFVKRGFAGRFAGRFLYPGWPSGVFYCLAILLGGSALAYTSRNSVESMWFWWVAMGLAGALFFPAAIAHTLAARWRRPFVVFLIVQSICAILAATTEMLHAFKAVDLRSVVALLPTTGLLLTKSGALYTQNLRTELIGTSIVTGASLVLLLIKMRRPWRDIRVLEETASALPPLSPDDASGPPAAE